MKNELLKKAMNWLPVGNKTDKTLLLAKNRRKRKLFLFSDLVTEKVKSENTFTCHNI